MPPKKTAALIAPVIASIISMALLFVALYNSWFGEAGANSHMFCEALRDRMIKQPANTWSNLGFMIAGLTIGYQSMHNRFAGRHNSFTTTSFYPAFFATIAVLLCPGSMAMHASTAAIGGFLDMLSMYLIASFMFAYALRRLLRISELAFFIIFGVALSICVYIDLGPIDYIGSIEAVLFIFAFFAVSASFIEVYFVYSQTRTVQPRWAVGFIGAFLVAFFIWNMSLTDAVWCDPNSLIQGHAIWHLLNAVSVYCMFRYYASEDEKPDIRLG